MNVFEPVMGDIGEKEKRRYVEIPDEEPFEVPTVAPAVPVPTEEPVPA